jgi:hypothetical protein
MAPIKLKTVVTRSRDKATYAQILCFVERASRYNRVKEDQLDANLLT